MKIILILVLFLISINLIATNTTKANRDEKLKQINSSFVKDVVKATKLKAEEVREFLPGNKNYGKSISEIHKLNLEQIRAVNQIEDQRKKAMFELRKKFGRQKPAIKKIRTKK